MANSECAVQVHTHCIALGNFSPGIRYANRTIEITVAKILLKWQLNMAATCHVFMIPRWYPSGLTLGLPSKYAPTVDSKAMSGRNYTMDPI